MATTTLSVPDASSSVSATAALSRSRDELTEELCRLAVRLAHLAQGESLCSTGVCLICGSAGGGDPIIHANGCTIAQVFAVAERLEKLRLEQLLADAFADPSDRQIVYRDPLSDAAAQAPVPVGLSHVEAAVLRAAGVPPEQRSAIYAEAKARQAADDLEAGR